MYKFIKNGGVHMGENIFDIEFDLTKDDIDCSNARHHQLDD